MKFVIAFYFNHDSERVKYTMSVDATTFVEAEAQVTYLKGDASAYTIVPVDPEGLDWIEMRRGDLWYLHEKHIEGFCRIAVKDCLDAAALLDESTLDEGENIDNQDAASALIRAGFTADALRKLVPRILEPARARALQAAKALRAFADAPFAENRRAAEHELSQLSHVLFERARHLTVPKERESLSSSHTPLARHAATQMARVNNMGNEDIEPRFKTSVSVPLLREMADEWETWAKRVTQ